LKTKPEEEMTFPHEWKRAWDNCRTPEDRRVLSEKIRYLSALRTKRNFKEALVRKASLEAKTCKKCGEPLPSLRRNICPACRFTGGR